MGRISIQLDDAEETSFREQVFHKFGNKKGALRKAAVEAVMQWTAIQEKRRNKKLVKA